MGFNSGFKGLNHWIDNMFRPIHWVIFRSIQLYVRVRDNYCNCTDLKMTQWMGRNMLSIQWFNKLSQFGYSTGVFLRLFHTCIYFVNTAGMNKLKLIVAFFFSISRTRLKIYIRKLKQFIIITQLFSLTFLLRSNACTAYLAITHWQRFHNYLGTSASSDFNVRLSDGFGIWIYVIIFIWEKASSQR